MLLKLLKKKKKHIFIYQLRYLISPKWKVITDQSLANEFTEVRNSQQRLRASCCLRRIGK